MRIIKPSALSAHITASVQAATVKLVGLGRHGKRVVLVSTDIVLLTVAMWVGFMLRYGNFFFPTGQTLINILLAPLITVAFFFHFDLYRKVTRYIGGEAINPICIGVCAGALVWGCMMWLTLAAGVPRLALAFYIVSGILLTWGIRQLAARLLRSAGFNTEQVRTGRDKVVIYGAGPQGQDLAQALLRSSRYDPIGFIDPNVSLWGQYVGSFKVYRPERLASLIDRHGVREVMLALPHLQRGERAAVVRSLEALRVLVRTLPGIEDIADGTVTVSKLRPVNADDLLGRDPVAPDVGLLRKSIAGKCVMVTGAGGSIGSEIARQALAQSPSRLVLFESSENALYQIEMEISALSAARTSVGPAAPEIVAHLGNVLDNAAVARVLRQYGVQTIFHAAAHKHVPIIERDPAAGLLNNTFGTNSLAKEAVAAGVERFVFISTDKAVRPTNVMGASKRLAEMALQARASQLTPSETIFAIVRFGNVLDSSGSVVPRFRQQIEAGGPVTVTHPDIVRYFMSIPEAASLVLQAGSMALGGEVFVLEMGEPVRIDNLARSMISLMGFTVKDNNNKLGDIEIRYVGLRPGEKLYEELFLGESTHATQHPRILVAREPMPELDVLKKGLERMQDAVARNDVLTIKSILAELVEGYERSPSATADAAPPASTVQVASPGTLH